MISWRRAMEVGFVVTALLTSQVGAADDLSSRVVVVTSKGDRDSARIAEHYVAARGIPRENIIALPTSGAETITWNEFIRTIWTPLMDELVRQKWIDAIPMDLTDTLGRRKYAVSGHRISYLVVCRGVPLRIMHDPQHYVTAPPMTDRSIFRTNQGAVDAELAMLARPNYPINAYTPNPLHRDDRATPLELGKVVKVSRLDGPQADDVIAMIDHALEAERQGLAGRAYVDVGGVHPDGDRWLGATAEQLETLGFDLQVDRDRKTIPSIARFDAPVLYFGWYAAKVNGPFSLPGFEFPPGAVALHIHSYSAATVRSGHDNWSGPLIARGVTATFGNVFEPYLQLTHRPDLLVKALARGDTFGDAAFYALPALSWQSIALGDPLYRPFAVSSGEQWKERGKLPSRLRGYAVTRQMKQLELAGDHEEALAVARAAQRENPTLAVGMALAERLHDAGDVKSAARELGFVRTIEQWSPDEWGLRKEAALLLAEGGRAKDAVRVFETLLQQKAITRRLRLDWLPHAISAASAAKDKRQASAWQKQLAALNEETAREKK
jgi:uncharacterized protein (TIGR03790 family)